MAAYVSFHKVTSIVVEDTHSDTINNSEETFWARNITVKTDDGNIHFTLFSRDGEDMLKLKHVERL